MSVEMFVGVPCRIFRRISEGGISGAISCRMPTTKLGRSEGPKNYYWRNRFVKVPLNEFPDESLIKTCGGVLEDSVTIQ